MEIDRATSALGRVLIAALALGALSAFGDWAWAEFIPDGAVAPGIIHGLLFFLALALVLGWAANRRGTTKTLLTLLPPTGLLLAGSFYPVAMLLGYLPALVVVWVGMWLTLAWAYGRAQPPGGSRSRTLVAGLTAAVGSGAAFWGVSGMWTGALSPGYWLRWLLWSGAFLPGLAALLLGLQAGAGPPEPSDRSAKP